MIRPTPILLLASASACSTPQGSHCLREVSHLIGEEELVYDLDWSPDGELLLMGTLNQLRLYRVDLDGELELIDRVQSAERFNSVQWSADGQHALAPTGLELRLYAVDPERGLSLITAGPTHSEILQRVALSPDGTQALSCDVAGVTHLYSVDVGAGRIAALDHLPVHSRCTRVAWSPSGSFGLSAGHEGKLPLYRVQDQRLEVLDVYQAREQTGEAIFGRDDREVISGSFGAFNELWTLQLDPQQSLEILETHNTHQSGVGSLQWSHDGQLLLTGAHDHGMHLMARGGGGLVELGLYPDDGGGVHSARWSPDDRWVARSGSKLDLIQILALEACEGE